MTTIDDLQPKLNELREALNRAHKRHMEAERAATYWQNKHKKLREAVRDAYEALDKRMDEVGGQVVAKDPQDADLVQHYINLGDL